MKQLFLVLLVAISATAYGQRRTTAQQIFDDVPTYSSGGYFILVRNSVTNLLEKVVAGTVSATNFTRSDSNTLANAVTKTYADAKFAKVDSNSFGGAVTKTALNAKVPVNIYSGVGNPLTVVTAVVGSLYIRTNGVVDSTLYVKMSGSDATGWYPVKH